MNLRPVSRVKRSNSRTGRIYSSIIYTDRRLVRYPGWREKAENNIFDVLDNIKQLRGSVENAQN